MRIRTIKPEIPAEVAAEIRGLFFGEGHIDLCRQGSTTRALSPRARLSLRVDDRAMVDWLKGWLGGSISHSFPNAGHEAVCWQLTGADNMRRLLDILGSGTLPSKKRKEVELLREAVVVRATARQSHVPDSVVERLHGIREELKVARRFVDGGSRAD